MGVVTYVVGLVAFIVLFYNPILESISPTAAKPQIRRRPRPQLNSDLLALEGEDVENPNLTSTGCPPDAYSVHIYSREPLVLYIEGFLTPDERAHLLDIRFDPLRHYCRMNFA
jgi:prolyl 4-hydroxylase